jgi:competence protein ComEA
VLAALAAAVALGAAAIFIATSSLSGTPVDAAGGAAGSVDPRASEADSAGLLVVDVAGAVVRPGVYRLAPGARIADALAAAGGFAPRVDAARVAAELNLAALVHDGDRIVVPARDDPGSAGAGGAGGGGSGTGGAAATPGLIDLNHASAEQLDTLPGIGPVTAAKIVASRQDQPFKTVDELQSRGIIGQKTFDKLKSLVTVG